MSSVITKQARPLFRVDLDSPITTWPGGSLQSLSTIFVHLERMALRQHREANSIWENENVAKLHELLSGNNLMEPGQHAGLRFRDLGRQIIETANAQVQVLQNRAHEVQSLLLINDWPVAKRLWPPLQAECRTPLYELNFLEDLVGLRSIPNRRQLPPPPPIRPHPGRRPHAPGPPGKPPGSFQHPGTRFGLLADPFWQNTGKT